MAGINGGHPSVVGGSSVPAAQQQPATVVDAPVSPPAARKRDTSALPPGKRPRSPTPQSAELAPRKRLPLPAELIASIGRSVSVPDLLNLALISRTDAAALLPQRVAARLSHAASTTDTLEGFEKLLAETFGPIDKGGRHLPDEMKAEVLVEVFKSVKRLPPMVHMLPAIHSALKAGARLQVEHRAELAVELAKSIKLLPPYVVRSLAFRLISNFIRGSDDIPGIPASMRAEPMTELAKSIEFLLPVDRLAAFQGISNFICGSVDIPGIPPAMRAEPLTELAKSIEFLLPVDRFAAFQRISNFIRGSDDIPGIPASMRAEPMTELFHQIGNLLEFDEITEAISTGMESIADIPRDRRREPFLAVLGQFRLMDDDTYLSEEFTQAIALVDSMPPHDRPECIHELSVSACFIEDMALAQQAKNRILESMRQYAMDSSSRPPVA